VAKEAQRLIGDGVRWITLLGQNVNSYRGEISGGTVNFSALLERLAVLPGVGVISFTTSHPEDATDELFEVIARQPRISRRFHLPLQSGSDRILRRMKRLHTLEEFQRKIERLRRIVRDVSVTTDLIAGFPGETEEDHAITLRALQELRFDGAYIYKYSRRPGTPAARLDDDVPAEVKQRRNQELLDLQKRISRENNLAWVGRTVRVFAEAPSYKSSHKLIGRSVQEKKAVFEAPASALGSFWEVRLTGLAHETFRAEIVEPVPAS
jgi:tRNA-2-methylthio-N6-dimethylallyladenosine synthase